MAATTQERENLAQLNQVRAKDEQEEKTSGFTPATVINTGEMIIIIGAALTVDLIDLLDLTGFGAIIARFVDIPALGALWLWRVMKHQAGPKKDPTFQILITFLAELSPIGIVPAWTIFVAYVYFQDSKLGQKTIGKAKKAQEIKKVKQPS